MPSLHFTFVQPACYRLPLALLVTSCSLTLASPVGGVGRCFCNVFATATSNLVLEASSLESARPSGQHFGHLHPLPSPILNGVLPRKQDRRVVICDFALPLDHHFLTTLRCPSHTSLSSPPHRPNSCHGHGRATTTDGGASGCPPRVKKFRLR
jgi:hypothetical protein